MYTFEQTTLLGAVLNSIRPVFACQLLYEWVWAAVGSPILAPAVMLLLCKCSKSNQFVNSRTLM
jgi:hypothetical protein